MGAGGRKAEGKGEICCIASVSSKWPHSAKYTYSRWLPISIFFCCGCCVAQRTTGPSRWWGEKMLHVPPKTLSIDSLSLSPSPAHLSSSSSASSCSSSCSSCCTSSADSWRGSHAAEPLVSYEGWGRQCHATPRVTTRRARSKHCLRPARHLLVVSLDAHSTFQRCYF